MRKEEVILFLLHGLIAGSCVVSILGAFQTIGRDWIQSTWVKTLITTELMGANDFDIRLTFGKGMAYATLYNPNYVGSYVAVVLPLTILFLFASKKMGIRILALVSTICKLVMLYGSQYLTGVIGVIGAVIAALIFMIPYVKKNIPVSVGVVVVCACLLYTSSASIRFTDFMKNLTECVRQGFRQFYCLVFRHTKMSREVVRMPKTESCHRRFAILRKITKNLLLLRMSACVNTNHMDTEVCFAMGTF